jgi:hypothetical protein
MRYAISWLYAGRKKLFSALKTDCKKKKERKKERRRSPL